MKRFYYFIIVISKQEAIKGKKCYIALNVRYAILRCKYLINELLPMISYGTESFAGLITYNKKIEIGRKLDLSVFGPDLLYIAVTWANFHK